MISLQGVVRAIVLLVVAGIIWWLCQWLVNYVGLPEPFRKVARVVLAIAAVLVVIGVLLSLAGFTIFVP